MRRPLILVLVRCATIAFLAGTLLVGSPPPHLASAQTRPNGPLGPRTPAPSLPSPGGGDQGPAPSVPDIFSATDEPDDGRGAGSTDGPATIPNEICVIFPPNAPLEMPQSFADDVELEIVRNFTMQGLGLRVYLMRLGDGADPDEVFEAATADQRPVWVQPNFIFRTSEGSIVSDGQQYALHQMRADIVSGEAGKGKGIRIALIDSGVDIAHESLRGAAITAIDIVEENTPVEAEVHGTVLASIIAGQGPLHGIVPEAELLAIRALKQVDAKLGAAETSSYLLSLAIETVINREARIINLSLTGPQDRLVAHMVGEALMRKVSIVAAAGNAGPGAPPAYPAAQDGVIAVTATDIKDRLYADANRGDYISVAAPGVDILGARPGGGYDFFTGTSMATGYATGLAALMLSRQPEIGIVRLRHAMEESAVDLGPPHRDPEFGAGRIDAVSALTLLP